MSAENFLSTLVLSNKLTYRYGRHVIFWLTCWIFFGLIYGSFWQESEFFGANLKVSFVESLFYLPCHMFLTYSILYFLIPRYLQNERYVHLFFGVVASIVVTIFLSYGITTSFIDAFRSHMNLKATNKALFYGLMAGLRGTLTVSGFAAAIKLIKMWYLKKQAHDKLEKEKLKAELAFLKGQLQPHFIFNALNSIYSMALNKIEGTPGAILKLSQLLRYSISDSEEYSVDLGREIDMLRDYIGLQRDRFGDRLQISLSIEGDFEHKKIAPLLLLPIVENAFKYGTDEVLNEGWISIDIAVEKDKLTAKIVNGKSADCHSKTQLGIGLQNVTKRLRLLYPNAFALRIMEEENLFIVILEISLSGLIETNE